MSFDVTTGLTVMSIKSLNPYLNFDGTAAQAIKLYERVLGANVQTLQRFSDIPGNKPAPEHANRVIHARLAIGEATIMVSDCQPGMPFTTEGNIHLTLDFDDLKDATARFDALASGGKVTMPLADTFWGATFGMLTDAYGIRWMFNCNKGGPS